MTVAAPDMHAAAGTLARAFFADPLFAWVAPVPGHRAQVLPGLFAGTLRHCAGHGGVVTEDAAVAGWLPLTAVHMGLRDLARAGLTGPVLRLGPAAGRRLAAHESVCERRLNELAAPRSAYLWVLGVEPEAAGQGRGGRLVRDLLPRLAAAGYADVVLKTEQRRNVGLYEHLGFTVTETLPAPGGGPTSWLLRRATDAGAPAHSPAVSRSGVEPARPQDGIMR